MVSTTTATIPITVSTSAAATSTGSGDAQDTATVPTTVVTPAIALPPPAAVTGPDTIRYADPSRRLVMRGARCHVPGAAQVTATSR